MYNRQRITSITTWIAGTVAVAVALLLPLGYFAVSYEYQIGSLETEGEMASHVISELISANPELWQYEQIRLEEMLARHKRDGHRDALRILDQQNRLVAESVAVLKPPLITRRFNLLDAGVTVGTVEIRDSVYPLLLRSGLAALLGLSLGAMIFVTLRVLPLGAVAEAEKLLRESEERYRLLVENAPDALLVYGNRVFLYANNAALGLFGAKSADLLIGQPLLSIVHPHNREQAGEVFQRVEDAAGSHQELSLERFDGTPIEVEAVGIPITYRGQSAVQVILHDITERKRLQAELTDKVALMEAALAKVKQLEGIIPICMYCKKIRNDEESWQQLEAYISAHSEARFSHGICPECFNHAKSDHENA